jgi:putative membrane protein
MKEPADRTSPAFLRNQMAADRTLMAWIRTSMSLITFGFTSYKFLQYVGEGQGTVHHHGGPRNLGLSMILLGTVALVGATLQHWQLLRIIDPDKTKRRWSLTAAVASMVSVIGLLAFLNLLLRVGPF